mgnify:CR=1 FL=1
MCRLLLIENPGGIDPNPILEQFRAVCKNSREYQGHGWGAAWLDEHGQWRFHHCIDPIWEDPRADFPETRLFLVHARSAFRDEGIVIENNMPFSDGESVFLFNGELRGVRIKAEGRIGAEKIYNFIRRFDKGDLSEAVKKGVGIIDRRTRYIRAMNFFLATSDRVEICSWFGEDPEYFQMHRTTSGDSQIVCSVPLPAITASWEPVPNQWTSTIRLAAG